MRPRRMVPPPFNLPTNLPTNLPANLLVPLLAGVVGLVVLSGCSGGQESSSASSADSAAASRGAAGSAAGGVADRAAPPTARRAVPATRAVVRTGRVALIGEDLDRTTRAVRALLREVGGTVDRADSDQDVHGRTERSTLVLRVPVARFEVTLGRLEGLGRLRSSTQAEKDVTTQVIDVAERVQTLQNSLDRLQRFQRAAGDAGDLVRFEQQITTRQSELQSLVAERSYLADQTSMSTITVVLTRPEVTVAAPGALDDAGFVAGLAGGWRALGDVVVVVLTALGAALPFLVAGALLGLPAVLLVRALRRRRAATP
jgi:hypothetical protein